MAVMLVLGAVMMAAVIPWRDGGAMFAVGMVLAAGGSLFAMHLEKNHLPKLMIGLREAVDAGDRNTIAEVAEKLVPLKGRASRALAVAMFDHSDNSPFVSQAAAIVRQIGELDQDAVTALRLAFVEGDSHHRSGDVAQLLQALEPKQSEPDPLQAASEPATPMPVQSGEEQPPDDDFVPPIYQQHSAFVDLMRRTRKEIGASVMVRAMGLIPLHGCDIPLSGFLQYMEAHLGVSEEAARARPFDPDEYWVATFGEQFLLTTKAFYKLGGLPEWIFLHDIESLEDDLALTSNKLKIHKRDGETVEYKVNWSTGTGSEIINSLEPALAPDYVQLQRNHTREHLRRNANPAG